MIISASRRTDIPAFHGKWFMERIREGYVRVANPFNPTQISQVSLKPEHVDIIVFWTKDPRSLLPYLDELRERGIDCLFQFTLTPYGKEMEPGLDKANVKNRFKELSLKLGAPRVLWRYDPIIFTEKMTPEWHVEQFTHLSQELQGFTQHCTISFLDMYKKIKENMRLAEVLQHESTILTDLAQKLSLLAHKSNMEIVSCSEIIDLGPYGITRGSCINAKLIESLIGKKVTRAKDRAQRPTCGCVKSRDIGTYGTCQHGCHYCYAQ